MSSTPDDLQKHRSRVAQELRQAGYKIAGREAYGVESDYLLRQRLDAVCRCDVFVGIVAMHYGDIPAPDEFAGLSLPGIRAGEASFTECEYRQALADNKQILMLLLDEDSPWPPSHSDFRTGYGDHGRCLQTWRDAIRREGYASKHRIAFFNTLDDLGTEVRDLVAQLPAAGQLANADQVALPPPHNLPLTTYSELVGREAQLRRIKHALHETPSLICVEGPVGAGRTSLALAAGYAYCRPRPDEQARHYVVWMAAEANTDKDSVLTLIAQVANYKGLAQVSLAAIQEKEQDIQQILRQHKFLLIVDNFDLLTNLELKAWLLNPALPGHVLLVVQDANRQEPALPPACTVTLAPLSLEDTLEQLALLGISTAETPGATPDSLRELALYTKGEFRVIALVVPQLKERLKANVSFSEALTAVMQLGEENKIQGLHQQVWATLTLDARKLLCTTPFFASNSGISREALLAACGLTNAGFEAAQAQLHASKLLKQSNDNPDNPGTYTVDADTYSFAQQKLRRWPEFEIEARKRWSAFYRKFVKRAMRRAEPDVPYWCSLVSNSMEDLDAEWPAVVAVLDWADQHRKDDLLLNLVLLLVHYMDSRLYNKERLQYANQAAQAARRLRRPYEEALLRIDALGWTYFDENCPHKALEEIGRGLGLVKPLSEASQDAWELFRLGLAWQARVKMEIALLIDRPQPARPGDNLALASVSPSEANLLRTEAIHLIEKALRANCSPWIRYRILKAAGDIAFKARIPLRQLKHDKEALDFYLQAEQEAAKYGGEGVSYQIGPRVGLAFLRRADQQPANAEEPADVAEAAHYFDSLCDSPHIPITGKLYGQYGKALIKKRRGQNAEAQAELDNLEKELRLHTSSNQLLKLVMSFDEPAVAAAGATTLPKK